MNFQKRCILKPKSTAVARLTGNVIKVRDRIGCNHLTIQQSGGKKGGSVGIGEPEGAAQRKKRRLCPIAIVKHPS